MYIIIKSHHARGLPKYRFHSFRHYSYVISTFYTLYKTVRQHIEINTYFQVFLYIYPDFIFEKKL